MLSIVWHHLFVRSWWVMAFFLMCFILYEQALKNRDRHYKQLSEQLISLQMEKQKALQKQKNLQLQINSQSDLAWIELTLMKGLGLVPEGEQKIYFYQNKDERSIGIAQ
ncbi:hypothetical protein [Candidatus Protochlamydia phocaeensis]|uniref:hypothetical protein n=1 Tax=Candidatus Protochlamydia phocaeensis TaxID=1414722 RepID=UPI000838784C|nr:hypothetical protein [Candidatus Protochlamydia phocaeensis]